jgi:putative heme transporter
MHLQWEWLPLAVFSEFASMAAVARSQRRLLRAGGAPLCLGSVIAVTYAGNAVSVSLPLAGPQIGAAYSFRQFGRRGVDSAVVAWALAVSGVISSLAFAIVLGAGALLSHRDASLGLTAAAVALAPAVVTIVALRSSIVRGRLNRALVVAARVVRRPGLASSLDSLLDRLVSVRLPQLQYVEVLGLSVWNWVADCLCLDASLMAAGATPHLPRVLLAYGIAMTAASFAVTPGGLGVVEAALTATLVSAGVTAAHALTGVLIYRVISFWFVMAAGWVTMAVLRRRPLASTTMVPEHRVREQSPRLDTKWT